MTLLSALNDVQRLVSLPVSSAIVADTQESQQLLYALAKRSIMDLARRHEWPALKRENSFTASIAELQASGRPSNFDRMIPETFWNRTRDRQLYGPASPSQWQTFKGYPITSTIDRIWMLRNDGLYIYPAMTVADTLVFEYIVNTPVVAVDGTTLKTNFTLDTDSPVLSEEILTLDVAWRYLKQKGLDYAEQMRDAELRIQTEISAQRGVGPVSIARQDFDLGMGNVPETGFTGAS